jgi:predicted Zn-dependent protease
MHLSALPPLRVLVASAVIYCASSASVAAQDSVSLQQARVQKVVDDLAARLGIAEAVHVSIVDENRLMMSVEPAEHTFELKVENGFIDGLDDAELAAAVAHELGHVWIFTHHPFLQTEQLANEVAMRLISREVLAQLYGKVWKRAGVKGDLVRFLGPEVSRGLASPGAAPESSPAQVP